MTQFAFTVTNETGQKFTGTLIAGDLQTAMRTLSERDLVVTRIHEVTTREWKAQLYDLLGFHQRPVLHGERLIMFTQQLAAMLDAGVTVKSALDTMHRDTSDPRVRQLLADMSAQVGAGCLLSDVLASYPDQFSRMYRATVTAAESGGTLPQAMATLALMLEKEDRLKRRVKSALYYPSFVMVTALVILVLLLMLVVPRYATFYAALGGQLPLPTRILLGTAAFLRAGALWMVLALFVVNLLAVRLAKTPRGRRAIDYFKLHVPVFGRLMHLLCVARFMRTVSSLIHSGIQLVDALRYGAETTSNTIIEEAQERVRGGVREGESVTECLRAAGVFTEMAITMVSVGEQSGSMDRLLEKVASYYEDAVETSLKGLAELVEPVVVLGVGIVVGFMIFALVLPVFNLMTLFMK